MKSAAILSLVLLFLFWAGAASATIALVQQNNANGGGTTPTVSLSANCSSGNVVVLEFSTFSSGSVLATSVSNLGNAVWTKAIGELASPGAGGSSEIWATTCGSTPGSSSTVTFSTSISNVYWNMSEWSGLTATQDSGSPTGSTTSSNPPSLTTTNTSGDLLIANAVASSSAPTPPGAPWVSLTTPSSFAPAIYRINSSTGTFSAFTTGGSGGTQTSAFVAFKAPSVATGLKGFFIP